MAGPAEGGMNFDSIEFYGLAALAAVIVVVLAQVAHFASPTKAKLPTIVVSTIAGFLAGLMAGMLVMASFGYHWYPQPAPKLPPGVSPPMQMGQSPGPPRGGPGGVDLTAPPKQPATDKAPGEAKPDTPSEPPKPSSPPGAKD